MKIKMNVETIIILATLALLIVLGIGMWHEAHAETPISKGDRVTDMVGRTGIVLDAKGCGGSNFSPMDGTGAVLVQWDDEGNSPEWKSTEYVFKRESRN